MCPGSLMSPIVPKRSMQNRSRTFSRIQNDRIWHHLLSLGLHGVGFEPTRLSTAELESAPLDHSGIRASRERRSRSVSPAGFEPATSGS